MRLLDANVFISAKNTYYSLDLVPAFWSWLEARAAEGELASTDMIYDELKDGGDELAAWVKDRRDLIFHVKSTSPVVAGHVATIGAWAQASGYAQHVIDDFLDCADPFLVGVAAESGLVLSRKRRQREGNARRSRSLMLALTLPSHMRPPST